MTTTAHQPGDAEREPSVDRANRLWSERAAARLGFDRLAGAVGTPALGPYLLLAAVYVVDVPLLSTIRYLQTGFHPYLVNPSTVFVPVLAVYALWSSRALRDRYERVVAGLLTDDGDAVRTTDLDSDEGTRPWFDRLLLGFGTVDGATSDAERLSTLASRRLKWFVLASAWVLYVGWILSSPTVQRLIVESEGPLIGGIKYGVLLPGVYLPLAVEFVVAYLGSIVLLPLKLRSMGVIDFEDPLGFGGLRPVGDLIRAASTRYLLGLGGYVAGIGLGHLLGQAGYVPEVGAVTTAAIVGASSPVSCCSPSPSSCSTAT